MELAVPVSDLAGQPRTRVGALAHNLARVRPYFAPLPGVCLTTEAYRRHLRRAGVPAAVAASGQHSAHAGRLAARAVRRILETPVDPEVVRAFTRRRHADRRWLVRVSSEDPAPFEEWADADEVTIAVRAAWASPWDPARVRARLRAGAALLPAPIAVLVQRLPRGIRAQGVIRPAPAGEGWQVTIDSGSGPPSRQALEALLLRARRLAEASEVHWLLAGRGIYALMMRPAAPAELAGIGASPGMVTGRARLVRAASDAQRLSRDDILVSAFLPPALTACVPRVAGIVLESGGSTSHLAVVARQFGIPAVLGVRGATARIRDGQGLTVDGTRGRVRFLNLPPPCGVHPRGLIVKRPPQ